VKIASISLNKTQPSCTDETRSFQVPDPRSQDTPPLDYRGVREPG